MTVFANLTETGGLGQKIIGADLTYDSSILTATGCHEFNSGTYLVSTSPAPHFAQVVDGASGYEPFSSFAVPNCGASAPGNGGLTTPGLVNLIAQEVTVGAGATAGTLILGTVTFHLDSFGTTSIATQAGAGGFIGEDFVNRTAGIFNGSVSVTNVPEPTTLALMGLGCLGLGLNSRRRRE